MPAEHAYVPSMPAPALVTADELRAMSFPDKQVELIRGVLVVREPPGYQHAEVLARLTATLVQHVQAHDLGHVLVGDAGFHIARDPDTVRGPDIAFIKRERVPHPSPVGFAPFAPDLVVEIRSPSDRAGELLGKVADWLAAGTHVVWVIDPERRLARVYRQDGTDSTIDAENALECEDVLPGFSCRLDAIL